MFCHLGGLASYAVPIPFAGVIVPLVLWLMKRDQYPLVNDQGKEAVNFQISMAIYYLISLALLLVLVGFVLLAALAVFQLVCIIIATMKASEGVRYRYPMCIRFVT